MTDCEIVEPPARPTAAVRADVAISELPAFFAEAFGSVMSLLMEQGIDSVGEPFALYRGVPGETADVEAGIPVAGSFTPGGRVVAGELPGGRVVRAVHFGPYETLVETYGEMGAWIAAEGLTPRDVMWEVYMTDPEEEPDPARWRTDVFWPVE